MRPARFVFAQVVFWAAVVLSLLEQNLSGVMLCAGLALIDAGVEMKILISELRGNPS